MYIALQIGMVRTRWRSIFLLLFKPCVHTDSLFILNLIFRFFYVYFRLLPSLRLYTYGISTCFMYGVWYNSSTISKDALRKNKRMFLPLWHPSVCKDDTIWFCNKYTCHKSVKSESGINLQFLTALRRNTWFTRRRTKLQA